MLFTYLKVGFNAIVTLTLLTLLSTSWANSNFQTVPRWMRPATAASSKKDEKAQQKSLTKMQREGYQAGADVAGVMQKQFGKNKAANVFAKNTTTAWRTRQQQVDSTLAKVYGFSHQKAQPQLYYFISFSMPKVLIQSYMLDAIWNGGILVLRGVTPGMSLGTFIRKRLMPLVHFKGAHARIEIDPNLFEQYHITRVPTMVITVHENLRRGCHAVLTHVNKTQVPYQRCLPVDAKNYWLLSGSVSTLWAFDKLKAAGAPTAVFRARMKGLHRQGVKNEPAFGGNWKTAPMPYSNSDIDALLAKAGRAQSASGAIGAVDVINQLSGGEKPHV